MSSLPPHPLHPQIVAPIAAGIPRLAIVGRGYSGIAAAIALVQTVPGPLHLIMIDAEPGLRGGTAYGRARAGELLNVRARDLSVLPGRPGDFAVWIAEKLYGAAPTGDDLRAAEDRFAPRASFGDYLRHRFDRAVAARRDVTLHMVDRTAVSIRPASGGYVLGFSDGPDCAADAVILATGYGTRPGGQGLGEAPYTLESDPPADATQVVLVGAGLTMVDALLRLRRDGSDARVLVISRRSLLPQPHAATAQRPAGRDIAPGLRLADLLREVRGGIKRAQAQGRPWQAEVNRLRPNGAAIWAALSVAEQRRFHRHLRRLWDSVRHRLAPDQHRALMADFASGRTTHRAGRVLSVTPGMPAQVRVQWRGAAGVDQIAADRVIDCSGHRPDLDAPLLCSLIDAGLARRDALGLGLDVAADGAVRGAPGLYALGPLGAGALLEITAAPEILAQAAAAARAFADTLAARHPAV